MSNPIRNGHKTHIRVLHLDDDPLYLEQFAQMLSQNSAGLLFKIDSVDNEDDYFKYLRAQGGDAQDKFDIIVLDVKLPGSSGREIAQRTRNYSPSSLLFMCSDLKDFGKRVIKRKILCNFKLIDSKMLLLVFCFYVAKIP